MLDAVAPGAVDWKAARAPPFKPLLRRPASIQNCNQAVAVARSVLGLPLVNVGGEDLANGERKQAAALLWQLLRRHTRRAGGRVEIYDQLREIAKNAYPTSLHVGGAGGAG